MLKIIDLISAICGSIFCIKSLKMFKYNRYNVLSICNLLFFLIQIVPMYLQIAFGVGNEINKRTTGLLYDALLDTKVDLIYCGFIVIVPIMLYYLLRFLPCFIPSSVFSKYFIYFYFCFHIFDFWTGFDFLSFIFICYLYFIL